MTPREMPPVWCPENSDGSYSWPVTLVDGTIVFYKIRSPQDLPVAYLYPRSERSCSPLGVPKRGRLARVGD